MLGWRFSNAPTSPIRKTLGAIYKEFTMTRTIALFFHVLKSDKNQSTPYLSTCLLSTLLIVINAVSIFLLLNIPSSFLDYRILDNKKLNSWLISFIIVTPIWGTFSLIFPKRSLEEFSFSVSQVAKAKKYLIVIGGSSLILMTLLLLRSGVRRGFINL